MTIKNTAAVNGKVIAVHTAINQRYAFAAVDGRTAGSIRRTFDRGLKAYQSFAESVAPAGISAEDFEAFKQSALVSASAQLAKAAKALEAAGSLGDYEIVFETASFHIDRAHAEAAARKSSTAIVVEVTVEEVA